MRTQNTGVVSSIPPCVTSKNAIGKEGNGKPPHEFHFPRKNSEPCLWFLLRSKPSMQRSSYHFYCKFLFVTSIPFAVFVAFVAFMILYNVILFFLLCIALILLYCTLLIKINSSLPIYLLYYLGFVYIPIVNSLFIY